jgi:Uma2 family endonuclease
VTITIDDGYLRVADTPTPWHQKIVGRLDRTLASVAEPLGWSVLRAVGMRVRTGFGYLPDLVICTEIRRGTRTIGAKSVVLVVEVVSPSSRHVDRVHKSAAYVEAGIPAYWRAEMVSDRLATVHCHRLDGHGGYVKHAVVERGQPRTIAIPIGAEITIDIETLDP